MQSFTQNQRSSHRLFVLQSSMFRRLLATPMMPMETLSQLQEMKRLHRVIHLLIEDIIVIEKRDCIICKTDIMIVKQGGF